MNEDINTKNMTSKIVPKNHLNDILQASKEKNVNIPRKELQMILRLFDIHFTGSLHFKADNTIEVSIPDPHLLIKDGPKELLSKHLYVNISKFVKENHWGAARCVKDNRIYDIKDLLTFTPLLQRTNLGWNPEYYVNRYSQNLSINWAGASNHTFIDKKLISPGEVVSVLDLDTTHPAIEYLHSRGFYDLEALYRQFRLSFCISENPQLKHIYYGADTSNYVLNPLGFTPQGRLIFFSKEFGKEVIWQGRLLDKVENDIKYHYAFYGVNDNRNGYKPVATRVNDNWEVIRGVNPKIIKSKYIISPGTTASNYVFGLDAALKWCKDNNNMTVGICEGVLDAARLGEPFCAVLGSVLSKGQAIKVKRLFNKVVVVSDNDEAGKKLFTSADDKLESLKIESVSYDKQYNDIAEITDYNIINKLRTKHLTT